MVDRVGEYNGEYCGEYYCRVLLQVHLRVQSRALFSFKRLLSQVQLRVRCRVQSRVGNLAKNHSRKYDCEYSDKYLDNLDYNIYLSQTSRIDNSTEQNLPWIQVFWECSETFALLWAPPLIDFLHHFKISRWYSLHRVFQKNRFVKVTPIPRPRLDAPGARLAAHIIKTADPPILHVFPTYFVVQLTRSSSAQRPSLTIIHFFLAKRQIFPVSNPIFPTNTISSSLPWSAKVVSISLPKRPPPRILHQLPSWDLCLYRYPSYGKLTFMKIDTVFEI